MASASKEKRFRLVCFDLDGTIIDNITNFWKFICEEHGCDMARKQKARDSYFNNLITYDEWVEHDVNLWKEAGVTRRKMMESTKKLSLVPGAVEALKELKKRGIKLGIISDSMDIALELISNHAELFDEIFINRLLFDKEGKISGWKPTKYGMEKKADGLKRMAEKEGFDLKECVFVGDGVNDVHAAEIAGLSISFNSSSKELDKVCDVVIRKKDLREILDHI